MHSAGTVTGGQNAMDDVVAVAASEFMVAAAAGAKGGGGGGSGGQAMGAGTSKSLAGAAGKLRGKAVVIEGGGEGGGPHLVLILNPLTRPAQRISQVRGGGVGEERRGEGDWA